MQLVGSRSQQLRDFLFDASGTIKAASTSQLLLPERKSTSSIFIQNLSTSVMYIETGSARATCTIQSGLVSTITITNGGFGFTIPPSVRFEGGGNTGWNMNNSTFLGCGQPGYPAPSNVAHAHAILSGGVVNSITIDNPGALYTTAPYVLITNSLNDPFGVADCYYNSVNSGIQLAASGGTYSVNGTMCTTDPISIYGTSGAAFTCRWSL